MRGTLASLMRAQMDLSGSGSRMSDKERALIVREARDYERYAAKVGDSGRRILALDDIKSERTRRGWVPQEAVLNIPLSRLITTSAGLSAFNTKVTIDVNVGRDDVPLLYGPIYDNLSDDALPEQVDTNVIAQASVVFLRRWEGGEVRFGHMTTGSTSSVPIVNYSAGFEYTLNNVIFDQQWAISRLNSAFGRAYNALLNHIHLDAINSFSFASGNLTPADTTGANLLEKTRNTIIAGLRTSANNTRPATVMLASGADRYQIQDALERKVDSAGNVLTGISEIDTIIFYDGYAITVGGRTYTYPGIASKTAYLIHPKDRMIELVKTINGQDLLTVTGDPDISRGIVDQIVNHSWRGLYADVNGSAQKLTLP